MIRAERRGNRSLTLIVGVLLVCVSSCIGSLSDMVEEIQYAFSDSYAYNVSSSRLNGDISMECIGTMYQGNAKNGYRYYRVCVPVFNDGERELQPAYDLYVSVEGEEYADTESYSYTDDGNFAYCYNDVIPSGMTGVADKVFLIRDGVEQVTVSYYEDDQAYYGDEPTESIVLQVPSLQE